MTRAEKLARELISLTSRYSDREFEQASKLLTSGELFTTSLGTVGVARRRDPTAASAPSKKAVTEERNDATPKNTELGNKHEGAHKQINFDDLVKEADSITREELFLFSIRYQQRKILPHDSSIRVFAQLIGLKLTNKLPARTRLLSILIKLLLAQPMELRQTYLKQAELIGSDQSSLKQWSDIIVKPT